MTTDDRKRELIERGRQYVRSTHITGGKTLISELCDALEAVFEAAQKPTDDERKVLAELVLNATAPYKVTNASLAADLILAAGFRRPVSQEPSTEAKTRYVCPAHPFGCPEPQGEPTDAETIADLRGRIEEARNAWWSATAQGDSGLIYTDKIEDAMDDIWTAIGHADWMSERAAAEEGKNR